MSITRNAGIYDLRSVPKPIVFGFPEGDSTDVDDENEDGKASGTDDEQSAGDEGDDADVKVAEEVLKHPRLKELSDENARHRMNAKEHRKRADAQEARANSLQEQNDELTLENAFIRVGAGHIEDFDAAWKLMDRTGISITEQGDVKGLQEAIDKVIDRYPYVAKDGTADTDLNAALAGLQSSGGSVNRQRRPTNGQASHSVLAKKFPALRHRK